MITASQRETPVGNTAGATARAEVEMITASQLRPGMAIRYEGQTYRVTGAEYHPGQGRAGGVAHTRLQNLDAGTFWEHSFRSELRFEEVPLHKRPMEFLYGDADQCCFHDPESYEETDNERGWGS